MDKLADFLKNSGYPTYEWDLASAIMCFERRQTMVLEERREILLNMQDRNVPENHLVNSRNQFGEFRKITGIASRKPADIGIAKIEADAWANAFQKRELQEAKNHNRRLRKLGIRYSKFRDTGSWASRRVVFPGRGCRWFKAGWPS